MADEQGIEAQPEQQPEQPQEAPVEESVEAPAEQPVEALVEESVEAHQQKVHDAASFVHYVLDSEPAGECRLAAVVGVQEDERLDLLVLASEKLVLKEGIRHDEEKHYNSWHHAG